MSSGWDQAKLVYLVGNNATDDEEKTFRWTTKNKDYMHTGVLRYLEDGIMGIETGEKKNGKYNIVVTPVEKLEEIEGLNEKSTALLIKIFFPTKEKQSPR